MIRTVQDIADHLGGRVVGDGALEISGVAPFEDASPEQLVFAGNAEYLKKIEETGAGAVLVPEEPESTTKALIVVANPRVSFMDALALFNPPKEVAHKVSPHAHIGEGVVFGGPVEIAPGAVIGDGVAIGKGSIISPGVVVEEGASIGEETRIHPNVTIGHDCVIGTRVIINAGSVVGSDGYGFAPMVWPIERLFIQASFKSTTMWRSGH